MKKSFLLFSLSILSMMVIASCKKASKESGSNSLRYEAGTPGTYSALYMSPAVGQAQLSVSNADPYVDIVGQIMSNAMSSSNEDKPSKYSELSVSNLRISSAKMKIYTQVAYIEDHLTSGKLNYKFVKNGTVITETLATFSSFNSSTNELIFIQSSGSNFTELFKNNPGGHLFFDCTFDVMTSPGEVKLSYDILFDYDYSVVVKSK